MSNPYRLPRAAHPTRYQVTLEPDLAAATFRGRVAIALTVNEPVTELVLNAIELEIVAVAVDGHAAPFRLDEAAERLIVEHPSDVGGAELTVEFTGTLNDKLRGFYRSTYRDADGVERVIATTQMQATDCRRAFPCWDEPDFKAVFEITLVVDADLLAVSNGGEVSRTADDDGRHVVRFADTMPMSTYLVAFVVGPLQATEPVMVPSMSGRDIPLRVIHVPGKDRLSRFALDVGAFALTWFERYYGIAYPTDKCDMLALPDFAAGAMENLGCIIYRESALLADEAMATQAELQGIADTVTHEIAHMWFGDLVTMRWWNGIWLNEAFATFMEIACCAAYRPDWQRWTTFSLERSMAFEVDALESTRSVEYDVQAPADCDAMFDVLTYQKGGSLLRMLEQYLGEEEFRSGVSHYLSSHEYGNTETGDLWDAIEEANPATPVRALMDSWIWQPGFPLLRARVDGGVLHLTQQRFAYGESSDATLWSVPVHLRAGQQEWRVLLDAAETTIELPPGDGAVVVNAGGHGFVRVAYAPELRDRLVAQLDELSVIERYNLVDDAWNEVVAGRMTAAEYLAFVEGFAGVRDLAVWQAIALGLRGLGRLVEGDAHAALRGRIAALAGGALADVGWTPVPEEDGLRAKLRGLLVSLLAVNGGDAEAIARCRELLDTEGTDPELVAAATSAVASSGDTADYERFLDGFRTASTPQEQLRYLYALAEFPSAELVDRTVELAFSGEVKTQNAPFLLRALIANRWHGVGAWETVRRRWTEANDRFPSNTIVRMIDSVRLLTDPPVVADVQAFFGEHPIPQGAKTLDQVLERQRVNAALRAREAGRFAP